MASTKKTAAKNAGPKKKAAPKESAAKEPAPKKPAKQAVGAEDAAPKKHASRVLERLVGYLERAPAVPVGTVVDANDAKLAAVLALVKESDPHLHALVEILVNKNTSYCVFDIEMYPELLLRGRRDEHWNKGHAVTTEADVCLARNGAGDIYVWNAGSGIVRFLVHDEGFRAKQTFANVDAFVEEALAEVIEGIDVDGLDGVDAGYLSRLRFALEIAGESMLDDDARTQLGELGFLET